MAQLNFMVNFNGLLGIANWTGSNGTMSFVPFHVEDSISWKNINFMYAKEGTNSTLKHTFSIGLYSLNGSTLSLANSASGTRTQNSFGYFTITATSATQNITPGTWWFGFLLSTTGSSGNSIYGQTGLPVGNAFPGGFMGGRMTESTGALPTAYSTSNLDTTGADSNQVPMIILST